MNHKFCVYLCLFALVLSGYPISTLFAETPKGEEAKALSIQASDKVFFRLTESDVKFLGKEKVTSLNLSVWRSCVNAEGSTNSVNDKEVPATENTEFEAVFPPKDSNLNKTDIVECLLENDPKYTYSFSVRQKEAAVQFDVKASDLFAVINKKVKDNPDNRKLWTIKLKNQDAESITLSFAGIRKVYQLDAVDIPKGSSIRSIERYGKDAKVPLLCVCIDQNGVPLKAKGKISSEGIRSKSTGWQAAFPATKENEWEIREGYTDVYLIRLRDVNTNTHEIFLLGVPELSGENFQREIKEKVGPDADRTSVVKFRFSLVNP